MKIFTAKQIRAADQFTIENSKILSIDLMERAAGKCVEWLQQHFNSNVPFYIFCGVGNNGGDGFALARILLENGFQVEVFSVLFSTHFSEDCQQNKDRFQKKYPHNYHEIKSLKDFPNISKSGILVDALFGTGLNRPLTGFVKETVKKINQTDRTTISIDIPSGLMAESNASEKVAVKAKHTLSFEFYKLAFLFPENASFTGKVHILPIGIHPKYIEQTPTPYHLTTPEFISTIFKQRTPFSHKGTYGHSLIIAGSFGKTGAAVLAVKANVHSGCGLTTVYVPKSSYSILQTSVPEAMCICNSGDLHLSKFTLVEQKWNAVGIGPGIGKEKETENFFKIVLKKFSKPMVIDADALNILSENPAWLNNIPNQSILTPHPKEFERLFGKTTNNFQRLQLQREKSKALNCTIVLKGHYTSISSPDGNIWFNTTGNAGMATGGSGDVLTGLLTGLLAQGYSATTAAILGVWLHGKAGDLAIKQESMESLSASHLVSNFGKAFQTIYSIKEVL